MRHGLPLRNIVVEGPIGVGKTTLAHRLAQTFDGMLLAEGQDENPFLDRFYSDPRSNALAVQLFFLMQRARQMQSLRQGDLFASVVVADFMIEKDRLFATLNLDSHELNLYEQIYAHLTLDVPVPDLVIYLQAPLETLIERVQRRGRDYERGIDPAYLVRVSEAYTRFFHDYDQAPLLIVNTAGINLADSEDDYARLLREIRAAGPGRQFFSPVSAGAASLY